MTAVNSSASWDGANAAWQQTVAQFAGDATQEKLELLLPKFLAGGILAVIAEFGVDQGQATSGASREARLDLDGALRTARLESAKFTVTVRPARRLRAGDAGAVRAGDAGSTIIDLGTMRTVTGLAYLDSGAAMADAFFWTGTKFPAAGTSVVGTGMRAVPEQFTERLRITWGSGAPTPELVGEHLTVQMPDAPSGLELRLGNRVLWTHPQEVQLATEGQSEGAFVHQQDFTLDLRAALESGTWPLQLVLASAVPALLNLRCDVTFERLYAVTLPGGSLVVSSSSEGERQINIPLGADSSTWSIEGLDLSIAGDGDDQRSVPSTEPSYSAVAELLLDTNHTVIARLPGGFRRKLRRLSAIRLPLRVDAGTSIEVLGILRAGDGAEPTPKEVGVAQPVVVEGPGTHWVELAFALPIDLESDPDLWIELNATRGAAIWPLAGEPSTEGEQQVLLRRGRPGGPYQSFDVPIQGPTPPLLGVLRLVGDPYADADLAALELRLPGGAGAASVSPGSTAREVTIDAEPSVTASEGNLVTTVQFRCPGTYRINAATVRYRLSSDLNGA